MEFYQSIYQNPRQLLMQMEELCERLTMAFFRLQDYRRGDSSPTKIPIKTKPGRDNDLERILPLLSHQFRYSIQ